MNPNGRCTIEVRGYLVWNLSWCFSLQNNIDWNTQSQFPAAYLLSTYMSEGVTSIVRLTHWGRVTHICVNKLTTISSDNGLPPGRRQAIIWTSAGILLTSFDAWGQNSMKYQSKFIYSHSRKCIWTAKCRPFCPSLNVLRVFETASSFIYQTNPINTLMNLTFYRK